MSSTHSKIKDLQCNGKKSSDPYRIFPWGEGYSESSIEMEKWNTRFFVLLKRMRNVYYTSFCILFEICEAYILGGEMAL